MQSNFVQVLKFLFCIVFINLLLTEAHTQACTLQISGQLIDEATQYPLSYANVLIQETSNGVVTDDEGHFSLDHICPGEYHLIFSHIGCASRKMHVHILQDTLLKVNMAHTATALETIEVKGKKEQATNHSTTSIGRKAIEDNINENFSSLLKNETGVYLIKNGSGISKPVVHGLYGNRLSILNNGVIQSGQQWGNDHSPEIDPFTADKITVLKGASAIEYGAGNLGGVILVEPKRIEREPHLHGQFNYIFETNGMGNSLNTRLEQYSPALAWRVTASAKKSGDKKTASYFLNNTGVQEINFSVQLEKMWKEKLFIDFYASTFNTEIGILRGAHIGNLTDLNAALNRAEPFFTAPNFSYNIESPRQTVSHHLAKIKGKYYFEKNQILELTIAGQLNQRKEFDVRRSGRSNIPGLSLEQYTLNSDLKYTKTLKNDWKLKIGIQNILTDNTNKPETGILPLIPDYFSWKGGVFSSISEKKGNIYWSTGLRYDYELQDVVTISTSIPREIIRYNNQYHNVTAMLAIKYELTKTQSIHLNTGFAKRNPAVNELYSNGLHQGVSGIERGDVDLKPENAFKTILEYKWLPNTRFSLSALAYYQHFNDYIFLNPQDKIELTIRGAFPVFKYEQTNARIYGLDIHSQFSIGHSLLGVIKYSYIKGEDRKNKTPLVFIPPSKIFGSLSYRAKESLKISDNIILKESEIEISHHYVFEQKNILAGQDFSPPPPHYYLMGMKISTNLIMSKYKLKCFVKVDNVFNVAYRDYLNRQRYFADDLGRSIVIGVHIKF